MRKTGDFDEAVFAKLNRFDLIRAISCVAVLDDKNAVVKAGCAGALSSAVQRAELNALVANKTGQ